MVVAPLCKLLHKQLQASQQYCLALWHCSANYSTSKCTSQPTVLHHGSPLPVTSQATVQASQLYKPAVAPLCQLLHKLLHKHHNLSSNHSSSTSASTTQSLTPQAHRQLARPQAHRQLASHPSRRICWPISSKWHDHAPVLVAVLLALNELVDVCCDLGRRIWDHCRQWLQQGDVDGEGGFLLNRDEKRVPPEQWRHILNGWHRN